MYKLLTMLVGLLVTIPVFADTPPVITLTERNTLVLRNVINQESASQVQSKAISLSQNLAKTETIYMFLDTPGGEIGSGTQLITVLRGLPQRVDTITNFAASMGFITAQSLGNRYILPAGILMSHRARGGADGQIPGELNTRVAFFTKMLDDADGPIAKRVGLSKKAYQALIHDEHWVAGQRAVMTKMADRVVLVRCDKDLAKGTNTENISTFFGNVEVKYSNCPLITAPLSVNFAQLSLSEFDPKDQAILLNIRKFILEMLYNKQQFYTDFVLTNKFGTLLP